LLTAEATFYYMPMQHAESLPVQQRSVELYERLAARCAVPLRGLVGTAAGFAREHRDIVERFGRFPHGNALLGRTPTAAETAFRC